jgi:hypothetical protein
MEIFFKLKVNIKEIVLISNISFIMEKITQKILLIFYFLYVSGIIIATIIIPEKLTIIVCIYLLVTYIFITLLIYLLDIYLRENRERTDVIFSDDMQYEPPNVIV